MQITRTSSITGLVHTRDMPVLPEHLEMQRQGCLMSTAFPHLDMHDRLFLQIGVTKDEWDALFVRMDANDAEGSSN